MTGAVEPGRIELDPGVELGADAAAAVLGKSPTSVIVLAGLAGSGKTTLLTSVYESFQQGPYCGFAFGGSLTMVALERLCFFSRIASDRESAETIRTTQGDRSRYLHLRVRLASSPDSDPRDIVISDLAGESFRMAMDSENECKSLSVLQRADHLVVLIDGARLTNIVTRAAAANEARALVRSCVDAGMIGNRTILWGVVTKWDLILASDQRAEIEAFVDNCRVVLDQFAGSVGSVRFARVAARPELGGLPFAFGVHDLFGSWVLDSLMGEPTTLVRPETPRGVSQFDYFAKRELEPRHFDAL